MEVQAGPDDHHHPAHNYGGNGGAGDDCGGAAIDDQRIPIHVERCTVHDDCRLVHRRHRSTGWWFQYHVHASGVVLAVDYDGTSFGHAPSDGGVREGA